MKEKITAQILQLEEAIARLTEALSMPPTQINKDGTIQRFEFTFELAWKTIQSVIREKGMEAVSPKDAIRTAAQAGLIKDVELWFDFLDARNRSSHLYSEPMADEVYEKVGQFLPEAKNLLIAIRSCV